QPPKPPRSGSRTPQSHAAARTSQGQGIGYMDRSAAASLMVKTGIGGMSVKAEPRGGALANLPCKPRIGDGLGALGSIIGLFPLRPALRHQPAAAVKTSRSTAQPTDIAHPASSGRSTEPRKTQAGQSLSR